MTGWKKIRELVQSTPRNIREVSFFGDRSKICLLDFVGLGELFISEFGLVWSRKKIYLNKQNILSKNYLPMATLDNQFKYPWVHLSFTNIGIWFPVNMLVGWAFNFSSDTEMKAQQYVIENPDYWGAHWDKYKWEDIDFESFSEHGPYYQFLYNFYQATS